MSDDDIPSAVSVLPSRCAAAVFRAGTMSLMCLVCPRPGCGVTAAVVDGVIGAHVGMAGECSSAGALVIDDRVLPVVAKVKADV